MPFEVVDKEDSHGEIAGSLYGACVRVIMRSPGHVLFFARGIQVWNRSVHGGWHNLTCITRDRASKATFSKPAVVEKIDALFGAGASALAAELNGKSKTILVDGGGTPMPLPRVQHIKKVDESRRTVTPDWRADLTGRVKTCKQCGEPLSPSTDHHRMGYKVLPDHPQSVTDCQRMTNKEVIAVHGYDTRYQDRWQYVEWFETWDGESYHDEDFCSTRCAAAYGRRAARELALLPAGGEIPETPYRMREDTDHSEPQEPTFANLGGKMIRLT